MASIFEDMVSDYHSSQETSKSRIPVMGEVETALRMEAGEFLVLCGDAVSDRLLHEETFVIHLPLPL